MPNFIMFNYRNCKYSLSLFNKCNEIYNSMDYLTKLKKKKERIIGFMLLIHDLAFIIKNNLVKS